MSETAAEVKARFLDQLVGADDSLESRMVVEVLYQAARIATALEKIVDEGIHTYPMKESAVRAVELDKTQPDDEPF